MPFPNFNPVLLQLGPLAIRWYALAYVAGILLGWRYGVALVRSVRIWRGTAPTLTERQMDDLVSVGRDRRSGGRPDRLDPVLQHERHLDRSPGDPQGLARRHVVSTAA